MDSRCSVSSSTMEVEAPVSQTHRPSRSGDQSSSPNRSTVSLRSVVEVSEEHDGESESDDDNDVGVVDECFFVSSRRRLHMTEIHETEAGGGKAEGTGMEGAGGIPGGSSVGEPRPREH